MVDLRLRDVNPSHPALSHAEADLLRALLRKRDDYDCQGRWQEARGVAMAALIAWQHLVCPEADVPTTWLGDL